jgi:hypothetical protein
MKLPSAIRNHSILSSPDIIAARRSPVSALESIGGHPNGIARRAFAQSGAGAGLFAPRRTSRKRSSPPDGAAEHSFVGHFLRDLKQAVHGAVDLTNRLNRLMAMNTASSDWRGFVCTRRIA